MINKYYKIENEIKHYYKMENELKNYAKARYIMMQDYDLNVEDSYDTHAAFLRDFEYQQEHFIHNMDNDIDSIEECINRGYNSNIILFPKRLDYDEEREWLDEQFYKLDNDWAEYIEDIDYFNEMDNVY